MTRIGMAAVLREVLVAAGAAAVLVAVVHGGSTVIAPRQLRVILPFLAVAFATVVLFRAWASVDRAVARVAGQGSVSPYWALAEAARRIQAGSLDEVLPGLAQVLTAGTAADRATIWLAVGDRLVDAAHHPPEAGSCAGPGRSVPGFSALLVEPDTDHVEPVLDGGALRAVVTITKPTAITAPDRRLVHDVAQGAALLLRVVALNEQLSDRVRRAERLAEELRASRQRLDSVRKAERRRLAGELSHVTGDRLAALRADLERARADLTGAPVDAAGVRERLARTRVQLDDLLDRFRSVARGVYPAVLRDQGPAAALQEVAADLPRPVRLEADPGSRLAWELESGLYYLTASALRTLAGRPAQRELTVRLEPAPHRLDAVIEDPTPPVAAARLAELLADDADRLVALGGGLQVTAADEDAGDAPSVPGSGYPPVVIRAWVPDRVEPVLASSVEAEIAVR
jgi:signal transduction histidine kinase